jgi:hypothetical protein
MQGRRAYGAKTTRFALGRVSFGTRTQSFAKVGANSKMVTTKEYLKSGSKIREALRHSAQRDVIAKRRLSAATSLREAH